MILPPLTLARYRFTLQAEQPIELPPHPGSTLRGGFGHAFKQVSCFQPAGTRCADCLLQHDCPYAYIFETPVPPDAEVLRKNRAVPHPLIIEPPSPCAAHLDPGETLTFHLILIGQAARYLSYVLVAFQTLGQRGLGRTRGRFHLTEVLAVDALAPQTTATVYTDAAPTHIHAQALPVAAARVTAWANTLSPTRLAVTFLTPTRLKHRGQWVRTQPPFHVLVRRLLDRVSSLAYFHGGVRWETDFRGWVTRAEAVALAADATAWAPWSRYSGRQEQWVRMGGLTGTATYTGALAAYRPLLALGALLHVGKGTLFGNGQMALASGEAA
jgi:hypothetical protein